MSTNERTIEPREVGAARDLIPYLRHETFGPALAVERRPVLIDFTAAWCPPCRTLTPVLEDIATTDGRLAIFKVDVDAEPDLAARFGVQSLPTLVLLTDGQEVHRLVGAQPKRRILDEIRPHLEGDPE